MVRLRSRRFVGDGPRHASARPCPQQWGSAVSQLSSLPVATLGTPRIGPRRELKAALESYWSGKSDEKALLENRRGVACRQLGAPEVARRHRHPVQRLLALRSRARHERDGRRHSRRATAGTAARSRSRPISRWRAARGSGARSRLRARSCRCRQAAPAQEMTKWFDTNYHYMVPEFTRGQTFALSSLKPVDEFREAKALGYQTRPVLLGPVTFLKLGKSKDDALDPLSLLGGAAAGLYRRAAPARRQRRRMGAARRAVPGARPRRRHPRRAALRLCAASPARCRR